MSEHGDFRILDELAGMTRQGYTLSRTALVPTGHTVQVKIERDSYWTQSYARAYVLSAHLTWTQLAREALREFREARGINDRGSPPSPRPPAD